MMMTKFGLADKWILLWTPEKNNFVVADDGEGTLSLSLSQNISVGLFFSSLFSTTQWKLLLLSLRQWKREKEKSSIIEIFISRSELLSALMDSLMSDGLMSDARGVEEVLEKCPVLEKLKKKLVQKWEYNYTWGANV